MPQPVKSQDVLFDGQTRLSRRDAVERHGERVVRAAEIAEVLTNRVDGPRPLRSPKRIFVSYKWGSKDHNDWVRRLVQKLEARGNLVTFDGQNTQAADRDIAELVGSMIECHYFLIVVEPAYVDAVKSSAELRGEGKVRPWLVDRLTGRGVLDRGWVYDEYHTCVLLMDLARITRIGLLKEGQDVIKGMTLHRAEEDGGDVFDVRNESDLDVTMDKFFANDEVPLAEDAKVAEKCIHASEIAFEQSDFSTALSHAEEAVSAVPLLAETNRCKAVAELAAGRFQDAAASALKALELEGNYTENRYMLALAFVEMGRPDLAIQLCATVRRIGAMSWRLSTVMGIATWCVQQPIAAVNHIDFACSKHPELRESINGYHRTYDECGSTEPPKQVPIRMIGEPGKDVRAMSVLQTTETHMQRIPVLFDGQFPEKRSAEARDRIIQSLAAYHLPATDMDSLNFMIKGQMVGPVSCSHCPARLPVIQKDDLLCFDCGLMLNGGIELCPACEGQELVSLISAWCDSGTPCPYCREGQLKELQV